MSVCEYFEITDDLIGSFILDLQTMRIVDGNDYFCQLVGCESKRLENDISLACKDIVYTEDYASLMVAIKMQLKSTDLIRIYYRMVTSSGRIIPVICSGNLFLDEGGRYKVKCLFLDLTQIGQGKRFLSPYKVADNWETNNLEALNVVIQVLEQRLKRNGASSCYYLENENFESEMNKVQWSNERKRSFLTSLYNDLHSSMFQVNVETKEMINANKATFELVECGESEYYERYGKEVVRWIHEADKDGAIKLVKKMGLNGRGRRFEHRMVTSQGKVKWVHVFAARRINQEGIEVYQIEAVDISALKEYQVKLDQKSAQMDCLTELLSKESGEKRIIEYLKEKPKDEIGALLVLDIDEFEQINKAYGYLFGDVVLMEVASMLKKQVRRDDLVIRLGGDEFIVFLKRVQREEITDVAEQICSEIKKIYVGEHKESKISCSIGIVRTIVANEYSKIFDYANRTLLYVKNSNKGSYAYYLDVSNEVVKILNSSNLAKRKIDVIVDSGLSRGEDIASFAFGILERTKDTRSAIQILLGRIGKTFNLDRVIIMETQWEHLFTSITYSWNADGSKLRHNPFLNEQSTYTMEDFIANFDASGTFEMNSYILERSGELGEYLRSYSYESQFYCAIYEEGVYAGAMVYEDKDPNRIWTKEERQLLKEVTNIISTYIHKINVNKMSKAKTDFLSRISHEIRTPMNGIIGMTNIAKSVLDDKEKLSDCLNKIDASTKYLLSIINDVLDMSKIESGKFTLSNEYFSLDQLVEELEILIRPQTEQKHIQLNMIRNYEEVDLEGDSTKLSQVLVNIAGNAVKFTPEQGRITIEIGQIDKADDYIAIEFSVQDTGIGIREENVRRIFNVFEQADEHTARRFGGTGLGLAISSNLVELMGGKLEVESVEGKGSKFFFTIKFKYQETHMHNEQNKKTNEMNYDFSGKHVLVAEDNMINAEIIETVLEKVGFKVDIVEDGREAVEYFKRNEAYTYDIILMDVCMPNMDGLEATRLIRNFDRTDAHEVPIVAMTANVFSEDIKRTKEEGMNGYLIKPIDIKQVYELIHKLIN